MANHSSAKKSIRQIEKRTAVNKTRMSRIRTFIKKALSAIMGENSKEDAKSAFVKAQSELSIGVSKGLIKKNTASRKISRLAAKLKAKA